ncbi:MAG: bifunctional glutamate N-acetyltransferase/amino-acid acetyltransferase ArgJ [Campylobacterales bacterium]|nr:bifunctional glutamate N-acetyltransferase/amino-acid acetyltransferase ArgJ [Campylobacterales bacterium]
MFSIFPIKGTISDIDGFYCDGISAGLKPNGDKDLGFLYSDTLCDVETIFTENKFQAAPLRHFKRYGKDFQTNFVLINSKNANAMTGEAGINDINEIFDTLKQTHTNIQNPVMSSTGVIGVRVPKEKIINGALTFDLSNKSGENLSQAIMTTDAYPKKCFYEVKLENGSSFKIGAVAKGAGMINPNLATMLCFICTDANIPREDMKDMLVDNTKTTFNAISVDGDTSTNDTVMLLANKKSGNYEKDAFKEALRVVMDDMAMMMVSDGEGAKKCVAFEVNGAVSDDEAENIAKALSNSLLVKTALFGEDPNWGRIASTVGSSGSKCSEDSLTITIGNVLVYDKGEVYFDELMEAKAAKILQENGFKIICNIGLGDGSFTAYGCDLGYEYIKINADYRT